MRIGWTRDSFPLSDIKSANLYRHLVILIALSWHVIWLNEGRPLFILTAELYGNDNIYIRISIWKINRICIIFFACLLLSVDNILWQDFFGTLLIILLFMISSLRTIYISVIFVSKKTRYEIHLQLVCMNYLIIRFSDLIQSEQFLRSMVFINSIEKPHPNLVTFFFSIRNWSQLKSCGIRNRNLTRYKEDTLEN